ncbi:hypothetical protein Vadar_011840 [Vaccinium darrowii]|uniref:Uncharacterized protein n=1 Tax=Vaccinium darrowii TaxID=229202 RepID=A0ACB7WZZ1_9ERIC|nr:hypothetical protein Vadar_011840 [Vaccinium darrowii]
MKILNWQRNGYEVKGIGIHVIPGIGKTTIMSNLNGHDQVAKMFDIVFWLKVSEGKGNNSIKKLRAVIARRLDLTKKTRNPDEVAQSISAVLERMRYLILLDDVKETLELREIEISGSNNDSKIVLATRNRLICSGMKLDKETKLEHLTTDEAWVIFQDVENKDLIQGPKILPTAHKLCEECYGLPLLIAKVAPTFKLKSDPILWEGVLDN